MQLKSKIEQVEESLKRRKYRPGFTDWTDEQLEAYLCESLGIAPRILSDQELKAICNEEGKYEH
jgi:hypothetical protein